MEWLVEKCVEMGVDEISFIASHNSERIKLKMERLQKLAISAMKQSLQTTLVKLNDLNPFELLIKGNQTAQKFIAHVDQSNPNHLARLAKVSQSTLVVIGPEGDFTEAEINLAIQNGFTKVSLGANRLRTETAGLLACSVIYVLNA